MLGELEFDQLRFLVQRLEVSTDKEAAERIGYDPKTVSKWKGRGYPIDEALRLLASDGVIVAAEILRRKAGKAAATKTAGLDSDDEDMRQAVASEILDRVLGKATQKQEMDVTSGGEVIRSDVIVVREHVSDDQESN